jgi:molybdopterin synthase catalytic subunit
MATIRVQAEDFDATAEAEALTRGRSDIGAMVSFVGFCRDEGGALSRLEIEHYSGMAEAEIARVADEAEARWRLLGLAIIHRFGNILPGQQIVLVVTASAHRGAAFEAADFLMDYLKTRAPFWKRAHRPGGGVEDWIGAKSTDESAAARWRAAD